MVDGKRHREKVGSKSNAIKMYQFRKSKAWEGKKLPASVRMRRVVRFSDLVTDVLEYSKTNKKSYPDDQYRTAILMEKFKDDVAESIQPAEFERFLAAREVSPATRNRYRALLKLMYRLAEENGKITNNPARLLRMKKENNGRVRLLTEDEEKKLRGVMKKKFSSHIPELDVALNTGLRLSEQYGLEWSNVDLERRILTIADSKTGEGRHIPLNEAALSAFRSLEKNRKISNCVFLRQPGHGAGSGERLRSPRECFDDAVTAAGLENFRYHDLRHTFASRLVMSGVDIRTVADLMGHKVIQMTMRYAHLAPEHKMDAVQRLAVFSSEKRDRRNVVPFSHRSVRKRNKMRRMDRATATETATGPKIGSRLNNLSAS